MNCFARWFFVCYFHFLVNQNFREFINLKNFAAFYVLICSEKLRAFSIHYQYTRSGFFDLHLRFEHIFLQDLKEIDVMVYNR